MKTLERLKEPLRVQVRVPARPELAQVPAQKSM
jgi:hypothetical protein